ncbi:ribosome-inactivating family protein [Rickettsiales bacterium LUAb2]
MTFNITKKLHFIILSIFFCLWGFNSFASVSCYKSANISLESAGDYLNGLKQLATVMSEPSTQERLRQTLPRNAHPCIQTRIINADGTDISLVFTDEDLYLQGFITGNGNYYYFSDSEVQEIKDPDLKDLKNISLGVSGNYNFLGATGTQLSYSNINGAINSLHNFTGGGFTKDDKQNIVRIIFIISEGMRFRSVAKETYKLFENPNKLTDNYIISWDAYKPSLLNWGDLSKKALDSGVNPRDAHIGNKDDVQLAKRNR